MISVKTLDFNRYFEIIRNQLDSIVYGYFLQLNKIMDYNSLVCDTLGYKNDTSYICHKLIRLIKQIKWKY